MNIAVAGTGYVGLSLATLLSQHNHVMAVDIIPEKVEMVNHRKSGKTEHQSALYHVRTNHTACADDNELVIC